MRIFAVAAIAALTIAAAAPAHAALIGTVWTADLNIISSNTIADAGTVLGTVVLTQASANEMDVEVDLQNGAKFVSTGGPHNAFAFSLDSQATPYTLTLVSSSTLFQLAPNVSNTPYGDFTNGVSCGGCGPGASHANAGPLKFTVSNASGITINDFIANTAGYIFSADLLGPNGGTGNVAYNNPGLSYVPLPGAALLFGSSLFGLGTLARRRKAA